MTVREYIGARYVPLFMGEWSDENAYEPLSIVQYQGNSYTSRKSVPVGIDIDNVSYWAETGNYNAQIEAYRQEVLRFENRVSSVENGVTTINESLPIDDYNANATVTDAITAVENAANTAIQTLETDTANKLAEKAFAFETVTDMKAAANLFAGAICHTNGFYTAGDGGAAWYEITNNGVANEMDVIACGELFAKYMIVNDVATPEQFGAYGNDANDDTNACQMALDKCSNVLFTKKYLVSKGDVTKYGDSASCLMVNDNQHIYGVGTLHCDTHAQSIFGIDGKQNIVIETVKLQGYGSFPILDGTTGRGEKGTADAGWYTSGFWYYHFNNSYDTSDRTTHTSYGTGTPWGTFGNGGFYGNVGSGILVTGTSKHIKVFGVESFGFNGAGITIGHYGDTFVREDIKILNCTLHDNYSAGVDMYSYKGLLIDGCTIYNIGHPDAKTTDTYQDPGYGVAVSISDESKKTIVTNNYIHDNVRKGIDAHGVDSIICSNNEIDECWTVGIQIEGNGSTSFARSILIANNRIMNSGYANNRFGAIFVGNATDTVHIENNNMVVVSNEIINCGFDDDLGACSAYLFNRVVFSNNLIQGLHELVNPPSTLTPCMFGTGRGRSKTIIFSNNLIDVSDSNLVKLGVQFNNVDIINANNNTILFHSDVVSTAYPLRTVGTAPTAASNSGNCTNSKLISGLGFGYMQIPASNGILNDWAPAGSISLTSSSLYYLDSTGTRHKIAIES